MARARRSLGRLALAVLAAALVAAVASPARALRALHVDALAMRADRTELRVGEVFHLAIHAHVRERVAQLDELVIPDVGTMQQLGDERHVTASSGGTDVIETLTLEPTQAGPFTFSGAYLDAIDGRTGKPSRFSSNPVRIVVAKPSALASDGAGGAIVKVLVVLAALLAIPVLIVVLILASLASRKPRRVPVAPVPAPAPPAVVPPPTPRDAVAEALRAYRAAPANGSLLRLRAALFAAAGSSEGATLRDALAGTADAALREALAAAEHAAFGPADAREAASEMLIRTTEGWLR